MPEYQLNYKSEETSSEIFLDDLDEILQRAELDATVRHRIMMVLSEVFDNALTHGNACDPAKTVQVRLRVNNSTIDADIQDQGQGGLNRIRCKPDPAPLAENGRGVDLVGHYADEVGLNEAEDGGLRVSIHFDIGGVSRKNAGRICSTEDGNGDH